MKSQTPGCAAGAARASLPESSGGRCCRPRPIKSMSAVTPTRVTAAPTPTAFMEGDPFVLIESMTIAGFAVGATSGYIYIRSEYPRAFRTMNRAIGLAYDNGYLGANVAGSGRRFHAGPLRVTHIIE